MAHSATSYAQGASAIVDGDIGVLTIDCRPRANALDEKLLSRLGVGFDLLSADHRVKSIAITGAPDSFLVGADLKFFADVVAAGDLARLLRFTRRAHELLTRIESSDKPVVAWIRGHALGAGLELALATHGIVASGEAKFAFPETGLGIYPGMGGTQRTLRRIGVGLAKWMIYTGAVVPAAQALEIGLIDSVCDAASVHEAVAALADRAAPRGAPRALSARFAALEELFSAHSVAELRGATPDAAPPLAAREPQAVRALFQLKHKGPLALAAAEKIIDRGLTMPLAEGIEEEFRHLEAIFSTDDARRGLASYGREQVSFSGS